MLMNSSLESRPSLLRSKQSMIARQCSVLMSPSCSKRISQSSISSRVPSPSSSNSLKRCRRDSFLQEEKKIEILMLDSEHTEFRCTFFCIYLQNYFMMISFHSSKEIQLGYSTMHIPYIHPGSRGKRPRCR